MFQFLTSGSHPMGTLPGPALLPPPVRGERPKGGRLIDIAGLIRQASTQVKVDQLLRSGKKDIHLISREKIDELISRAIRNIVEKYRATGTLADPVSQRRMEAESKEEFDDLLSQHEQTSKAQDDLALSKLALDRELQDMRDDLAQQRALADGRLPEGVERAMVERRFEKLYAHFAAMDRALGTLFSSKLYSYRQIQTLLRQSTAARKAAALKAQSGFLRNTSALAEIRSAGKPVARADPAKVAPASSRRIEPFQMMELELGRGLDVGTVNVSAAVRRKGTGLTVYNIQRNAFLDVRDDAFARKMLKYGIDYLVRGERGYVIGDPAFEFANIFEKSIRRPMKDGMLSSDEPDAILVVTHLVEGLLGPPQAVGEICAFSVPGDPIDVDRNFIYHRSALEAVLSNMGYTPRPMLESHLIVFAELKEQDYTGIGVSLGGGMVNVCVAYKSVPTLAFSTLRGGDWIDASAAAAIGLPAALVCAIKEGGMDLMNPKGRAEKAIAIYYRHFIQYTLDRMKQKMEGAQTLPTFAKPIHLIFAGGTSMIPGFVDLFREEFDKVDFPIEVAEIRMASNPLHAVAEGCLHAALAETRAGGETSIEVAPAALERGAIRGVPKVDPGGALLRLQSASAQFNRTTLEK
jgi:hypothetical protein